MGLTPFVLLSIACLAFQASANCSPQVGDAEDFEYYALEQTWQAEFCNDNRFKNKAGCRFPTEEAQQSLTIHGLWPNYMPQRGGDKGPFCCDSPSGQTLKKSETDKILSSLQTYWPDSVGNSLWQHEWEKHGTCSGMTQYQYLKAAIDTHTSLPTAPAIQEHIGDEVSLTEIEEYYTEEGPCVVGKDCWVGVGCKGGGGKSYLKSIFTCWSKELEQIICPASVLKGVSRCKKQVSIRSF